VGGSVGHYTITAGTLGCFVRRRAGDRDEVFVLSNNHVLADENRGTHGDAVIQPGRFDGGRRGRDTIGSLAKFERLRPQSVNYIDAALSTISPKLGFQPRRIANLGNLQGPASQPLFDGDQVAKVGRTTGLRRGRVTAFEVDNVVVEFDIGNLRFDNQIEIEGEGNRSFSDGGDSGSLIVNDALEGAALLFAGGDQGGSNGQGLTYANPLPAVLDTLKVDLYI
jgi:hypothetical protein